MTTGVRTLTLLVSAFIFVFGGVTGFRLLTASSDTDGADAAATCKPSTIPPGGELDSNLVTVNVFNSSERSGLANRVTINLQANGFLGGEIGNNESATKPRRVAILTDDRTDPRVRLVAAQFRDKVTFVKPDVTVKEGVIVIVGDDYNGLKSKSISTIKTNRALEVCEPVVPLP